MISNYPFLLPCRQRVASKLDISFAPFGNSWQVADYVDRVGRYACLGPHGEMKVTSIAAVLSLPLQREVECNIPTNAMNKVVDDVCKARQKQR